MSILYRPAPELITSAWFNTDKPIALKEQLGRVVVIHAFQMLCPGCVSHGIPQTQKMAQSFSSDEVLVLGLHTVFEHHQAMNNNALDAFIHEYRLTFPIAVDQANDSGVIPQTMALYAMQGTPTTIIIDKHGLLRLNYFGRMDDLLLGKTIGQLVSESHECNTEILQSSSLDNKNKSIENKCDQSGCSL